MTSSARPTATDRLAESLRDSDSVRLGETDLRDADGVDRVAESLRDSDGVGLGETDLHRQYSRFFPNSQRRIFRRGFSLLEAILAIALTAIVMGLTASAVKLYLQELTVRRARIEQAQLARAILRQIADDLRSVVVDRPQPSSSGGSGGMSSGTASSGSGNTSSGGSSSSGTSADSSTASASAVGGELNPEDASAVVPAAKPGVYGNQVMIQMDVSRLPRYEEYSVLAAYGNQATLGGISDVNTVSYFVMPPGTLGNTTPLANGLASQSAAMAGQSFAGQGMMAGGLVRRVLDRSVSRWAAEMGDATLLTSSPVELLAPEVVAIQFTYFDGLQWYADWDSELQGGVPTAVEIVIVVRSNHDLRQLTMGSPTMAAGSLTNAGVPSDAVLDGDEVFRQVVYLPAAEPIDPSAQTATETETQ